MILILLAHVDKIDPTSTIRSLAGRRKCLGLMAAVLDLRQDHVSPSRYHFVGATGANATAEPCSMLVIMDSNVLIDLERAARRPEETNPSNFGKLVRLMHSLLYEDVIAGVAIRELAFEGPSGGVRPGRAASLRATMDAWFDCGPEGLFDPLALHRRWRTALESYGDSVPQDDLDLTPFSLPIYTSLLKLSVLWNQVNGFKARQRVELFRQYCLWASDELQLVSGYARRIAQDLLLSTPDQARYTRQLLKFGANPLRELRGATWDVLMLNFVDFAVMGRIDNPSGMNPTIVTADKGLAELRRRLALAGVFQKDFHDLGGIGIMAAEMHLDKRLVLFRNEIEDIFESLNMSSMLRLNRTPDEDQFEAWRALASDLEQTLTVNQLVK